MDNLNRCPANYMPLSPIIFLKRAGNVYREHTSVVYGSVRYTWAETLERCIRLASAISSLNISSGDVVAVVAPNIPAMYELQFGVPMAGAVLCCLNIRHDARTMSVLLRHSKAKVIFVDFQFLEVAHEVLNLFSQHKNAKMPILVLIPELNSRQNFQNTDPAYLTYESLLSNADKNFETRWPDDEWDSIALNYTSGTTSSPKGVVFSHRGAYLNSLACVLLCEMASMPVYLWTVPMFHCNGWSFAWAIAAQGGTNVCLRNVTASAIFDAIVEHKVTHLSGAPTVLNIIANAQPHEIKPVTHSVQMVTGGAPPPAAMLYTMTKLGFHMVHSYGLTETYGPSSVCAWKPQWDSLPQEQQAKLKARQGVPHLGLWGIDVKNPETMESVYADGKTIGEVMIKGNTVMKGYFNDVAATEAAFDGGWFRTGDLGVMHPDGYIELKDRSKDIIISGGENVSTIEVESILYDHPEILEAAVVGRPDEFWGETPCAFVKLKEPKQVTAESIIAFCRARLPHFMAPKTVIFQDLPRSSTGKVQKVELKQKAKALGSITKPQSKL
ncbi:butanoate--CoA ligase AAE1 isoform X1 [Cryptomeria japonica]|uniref:butanoate--CoA ligase AAE1 isoform X1 n=1 Tax=Cryptomeria japonica TaxID=3369 RepID=UPI0025AD6A8E|nr:butanoate--CoA ligase AAE1 isoform X1 [Cryptomeria japonica]XP_057870089.1 butanoate--CoA ligase AAE1 isoform X1 [Cryptomeria japonica]XP_057870090.1 butanoate--CoA ligase AAE1 isoform X1 [Cryptomeria japonica]